MGREDLFNQCGTRRGKLTMKMTLRPASVSGDGAGGGVNAWSIVEMPSLKACASHTLLRRAIACACCEPRDTRRADPDHPGKRKSHGDQVVVIGAPVVHCISHLLSVIGSEVQRLHFGVIGMGRQRWRESRDVEAACLDCLCGRHHCRAASMLSPCKRETTIPSSLGVSP